MLRILLVILVTFCFMYNCEHDSVQENGYFGDTATIQGIKVLFLSGSHYDRGYQHGELCANEIMDVFDGLLVSYMCKSRKSLYDSARTFMETYFTFEDSYIQESRGMIDGMHSVGVPLVDTTLKRAIDYYDLLVLSALEELYTITDFIFGCSSISSWGESTQADSLLEGDLIITRHWDYPEIPAMIRNLLLVVHEPSESNEQKWVSCNWAGMIGTCSGMNENGIGAFLDYGDYLNTETPNLSEHHPVALSIRNGIEKSDYNADGEISSMDVYYAVGKYIPYFESLIHVVNSDKNDSCAMVIESDNVSGFAIRFKSDNTEVKGDNLVLTNHYRILYQPATCNRYKKIVDSLNVSLDVSYERSWLLLAGAGATPDCRYSVSYVPKRGIIRYSVTTLEDLVPAYDRPSATFMMDKLFRY